MPAIKVANVAITQSHKPALIVNTIAKAKQQSQVLKTNNENCMTVSKLHNHPLLCIHAPKV